MNVYVNANPLISAGPDRILCTGSSVTLTASGGVSYSWNPGASTTANISVNPTGNTTYVVTGTDANGCVSVDTAVVTVNPLPLINLGPDLSICSGSTIALTALGASTYSWNPGGANTATILVSPLVNTNYIVTGSSASGCIQRDTITVNVNPVPVVNLFPTFICPGFNTILDAGNPGSAFAWSTGETSQSINVSDSGTYTVVVTSSNGCPSMGTSVVTIGNTLTSTPVTTNICDGNSATLQAGNPGSTYSWSNGSTASSITVSTPGNYFVTITDANGCTGTLMHTLNVNPNPVTDFSAAPNCAGTDISFNNLSSISSGSIQSYNWDFGDTSFSTISQPIHAYTSAGTYQVALTITSASGCSTSATRNIDIYPRPIAAFSSPAVCEGVNSVFSDASSISSGTITSWNWNFGNGNIAATNSVNHTYSAYGNYTATLIVTSDRGCIDSIQQNIQIHRPPVADFIGTDVCANAPIQYTNTSTSGAGSILFYAWNFGDGNSGNSASPIHSYNSAGSYNVSLSITSSLGCTDSNNTIVTIYPIPAANFTVDPTCENSDAVFSNTSSISAGSITNYYWNFGDNSSSNLVSPLHTYTSAGNYQVDLITTSDNGCRDTIQGMLIIDPLPVANFTAVNVCADAPVEFLDLSSISTGSINSWAWDFGDGTASSSDEPVHIYNSPGSYVVTLTVTSSEGCSASFTSNVNIYPNPSAAFLSNNVCLGNGSVFINQSDVAGGIAFYNMWSFSDGTQSTQTSPLHTFTSSGTYTILLTVTSVNGCMSTATQTSRVYIPPTTLFIAPDVCHGAVTRFDDNSYSQDGHIATWLWNFGDGSMSTEGNPSHLYTGTGKYNVSLTTTSSFGCSSPYEDTLEIYTKPVSRIQTANVCEGIDVEFINTTINNTGTNISYLWDLGNGFTSADSSLIYNFDQPGTYDVTLTATSSFGCSDTQLKRLMVYPNPQVEFAGSNVCLNTNTSFANTTSVQSGTIQSYTWSFGDGTGSSQKNAIHQYPAPGTYQVNLTAVTDYGCVNSYTNEVLVYPNPTVIFAAGYQGCAPISANFNSNSVITSGTITGWLWNFGDGAVSTNQNAQHIFTQGGNYDVSLTVVSDMGCQAAYTQSGSVRVFAQPIANFTADPLIGSNLSPTIHFTNLSQGFTSYVWNFGDGTSTNTDLNPIHTFADTGIYSAQLITVNSYGCRDTIMRRIEIRPHSTLFPPNCYTPNADGSNDMFRPYFTNMTNIQVWIFDRWGLLLTNWDGLEGNWDGYYNGEKCQEDTYVYKIKGTGVDGKYSEWVGHVSIVY